MVSQTTHAQHAPSGRGLLRMICPAYPAFNIYSRPARATTALGPVCVATAAHDLPGWDAELVDENNYRNGPRGEDALPDHDAIQASRRADVVGLYGGLTSTIPRLMDIAGTYKRLGATVVVGGQHFVGENIERALRGGVDIVVIGEGEQAIGEILQSDRTPEALAEIAGIAFLDAAGRVVRTPDRPPITDFDCLPIPDFGVLRYAKLSIFPVSGVRGCGMNCEFCAVKGKPRRATPQRMLAQFAAAHERWGGKVFFIVDDLFGQHRGEALELCRMLRDYQREVGVQFSTMVQIRLDRARDAELLTAMREAGISILAIGFESPIREELEAMDKRLDPEEMVALTRLYRRAGFRIHGMFIFGYPLPEGRSFDMPVAERVRRFRRFIRRTRLDTVQVLLPVPLPGTELTARLEKQGRIYSTDCIGLEYHDGQFPVFEPDPPLTAEAMQNGVRKIMGRFYQPRHLLAVALSVLALPTILLYFHRVRSGWQRWQKHWLTRLYRTGGWLTLRKWTIAFKGGTFLAKLAEAKRRREAAM